MSRRDGPRKGHRIVATPRILLLSRKAIESRHPELLAFLATVPVSMCVAQCEADKNASMKICDHIATFTGTTAIVADFVGCMCVNDDGSAEAIVLPEIQESVPEPLLQLI